MNKHNVLFIAVLATELVWLGARSGTAQEQPKGGALAGASVEEVNAGTAKKIWDAAPEKPRVAPKKPRRVLIWITPAHLMAKDPHKGYCLPYGTVAMKALGEKSKAFEPVISNDQIMLHPDNLSQFDAVILQNCSGQWTLPGPEALEKFREKEGNPQLTAESVEKSVQDGFLEWLKQGRGIMAYHFAIASNPNWPEYGRLFCGYFAGHPWCQEVGIKLEEPDHPLLAAFGGKDFRLVDEIYEFGKPGTREKFDRKDVRVLISLEPERTNAGVPWIAHLDNDFAQAWVRRYGEGRLFYTGFGHVLQVYQDPVIMQFFLDGIQFACGDLDAPAEPRASRPVLKPFVGSTPPEVREARMKEKGIAPPDDDALDRIGNAAPAEPAAKPEKRRRVLVWGHAWAHPANPFLEAAVTSAGKKSGAFEAVVDDNPRLLIKEHLKNFDALVLLNLEPEPFLPPDFEQRPEDGRAAARKCDEILKKSILEFVNAEGKGLVGINAAKGAAAEWPEYRELAAGAPAAREQGKGRVFFIAADLKPESCYDPEFLKRLLAGVQFALGDLPAGAAASAGK